MGREKQKPTLRTRKISQKQRDLIVQDYEKKLLACKTALGYTSERMNESQYRREKTETEARRAAAIDTAKAAMDAAEAAYKREMEALDLYYAASKAGQKKRELSELTRSRLVITDLVMEVLPTLGEEFTSFDIERAIEKKFPDAKGTYKRNSLSGTISRLKKRKVIDFARRGSGPEGSTYKRL